MVYIKALLDAFAGFFGYFKVEREVSQKAGRTLLQEYRSLKVAQLMAHKAFTFKRLYDKEESPSKRQAFGKKVNYYMDRFYTYSMKE